MMIYKKIVAVAATVMILGMPVLFVVMPKADFSDNENRVLTKVPKFDLDNLVSGQLTSDIEDYCNDHLPFRDQLVALKNNYQQAIGYKELGGVFVTADRLLQHIDPIADTKVDSFAKRVKKLADNLADTDVTLNTMMIPTDAYVYSDELPANAPDIVDEEAVIENIYSQVHTGTVNVAEALLDEKYKDMDEDGSEDNLFYKLDHHWTYYGAYIGYASYMESIGLTPHSITDYKPVLASSDYKGSLYSKALVSSISADDIIVPSLADEEITVYNKDKDTTTDYYYYDEFLDMKDKYCYFAGGNPSLMTIENENATTDREIVLIKDSFANSMVPFLIKDFKKIHILDLRYYVKHASDYIKENEGVTDVLVIYNVDSLNINNGMVKIQ